MHCHNYNSHLKKNCQCKCASLQKSIRRTKSFLNRAIMLCRHFEIKVNYLSKFDLFKRCMSSIFKSLTINLSIYHTIHHFKDVRCRITSI
jgi:hypothetical protein